MQMRLLVYYYNYLHDKFDAHGIRQSAVVDSVLQVGDDPRARNPKQVQIRHDRLEMLFLRTSH